MLRAHTLGLTVTMAAVTAACAAPVTDRRVGGDAASTVSTPPAAAADPPADSPIDSPIDSPSRRSGTTMVPPMPYRMAASPTTAPPTTAPPVSATPITPAPTSVPGPRRISIAFTGDILPHSPLWRQAARNATAAGAEGYDFRPMLARLAPVLESVDLAICHLETPIAPEGEGFTTMPRYGVPAEIVEAIAHAGYDRCSTASNHAVDRGGPGIDRTVDVLDEHGVSQAGMARTPAEIVPTVLDVGGVALTHLSYTWSYNGLSLPEGEDWRSALIEPDRVLADVATARAMGAEVVVVSVHWGEEKIHAPSRYQREIADALTAPGTIDLIVGHHAHVLQPIEQINDTWVVYGLGNVLSNMPTSFRWPDASQDAAVVAVDVVVDDASVTVSRPRAHPTWVDKDAGWIALVVQEELARTDISAGHRGRLERSLDRTRDILGETVVGG